MILAVLSLGGISYALLQSWVVPALPQIQTALHTSESAVGWVLTAYLLSASIATPIIGRLGDMYGKERLLMIVLLMLALGTLISAVASSLWLMILGPVIQGGSGVVVGGCVPETRSYHWLFWFPLAIIVFTAFLTRRYIPESPVKTPGEINSRPAALQTIGIPGCI